MPLVASAFRPPWALRNGHVQTILAALRHRPEAPPGTRQRLELPDGDFLDLDWHRAGHPRAVILSHGLEGSSRDPSTRGLAAALNAAGWDALAWNFRGCSGELNRLPRFYHSGETGDLAAVIAHAAPRYDHLALVGFSLGGNMLLKYLAEAPPHPAVRAAIAVSAPIDLAASARELDRHPANRLYLARFMRRLTAKVAAKAIRFPGAFDLAGLRRVRTFAEFDDRFTARIHGFRDAADYWRQSSALPLLPRLTVPTLLLQARNDPFLPPACFPFAVAESHPALSLETPASGGHLGFLDARGSWLERRGPEFLNALRP